MERFPSRYSDALADRVTYARDLWPRHHIAVRAGNVADHRPRAVCWPETTAEVQAIVRWARATKTPIVPFGAGSGVCGGVLPSPDTIVIDVKRMDRWRALDEAAPMLEVEAGHMGSVLEERLERKGLTLGHFPSSISCSTVGGWVAARSAGQASGRYGKIEDMVVALECVTGAGEICTLHQRSNGPSLVPLVIGSEGTLAIVTSATLRLHRAPTVRAFAAWSFPTTEAAWESMRAMFQSGLRPAIARLYDPFDAMLARRGGVRSKGPKRPAPDASVAALRAMLGQPHALNELLESSIGARALGGALLLVIFDGTDGQPLDDVERARSIAEKTGLYEGEAPARRWLAHRYSVSYRQAPMFKNGFFVDTMEVAATWSRLGDLYSSVRNALADTVFVMAHFSHAYPDGCCIYFSFAGADDADYDRTWRAALSAATNAGGTLAHHHGVGRSKSPRLSAELGGGLDAFVALKRAFDPDGILNPGALVP